MRKKKKLITKTMDDICDQIIKTDIRMSKMIKNYVPAKPNKKINMRSSRK